ncbi:TonB-dependent receptor [Sphingobacterium sp. SGG-5]|uniref:TonB-dependent receptor n=1 Tax=Sphingobacterium sp. SGG-5 TaxID=2710881 RepID=UPI0013ED6C25|nr:TonB-dependent receptor [Sphingobacterium sp. SGG-5]NGM60591.1 TonB-dependent receptor [Sphingobacterium sp. SGG-5]
MLRLFYSIAISLYIISGVHTTYAQEITGIVQNPKGNPIESATISIEGTTLKTSSDAWGKFTLAYNADKANLFIRAVGYQPLQKKLSKEDFSKQHTFALQEDNRNLEEVVVSGTMKEMSKLDSPVPVEVYTAKFFKANPTPSIFDALQNINGVRPQLNCNICNTGDIHINGLEGPYTMVLIDGMPIVSGLSTVYGLSGIPQALIERVEIVKGPASTLYGSEAVGGLINIITKKPNNAPVLSADVYGTSWGEVSTDVAAKFNVGKRAQSLFGANYFNYQNPIDNNSDNFTDVTLQNRISIFNKWNFDRKDNRVFSLAGRYVYEDRWGGEMDWSKAHRGSDEVYGESIYTSRWEFFGTYELPVKEKILFQFSANGHDQNSYYGDMPFMADQYIGFGQLNWFKTLGKHDLLTGLAYRYTYYNDDTGATVNASHTHLPALFVQDEITLHPQHKLLLGMRYDYNSIHGSIFTPRLNYKWNSIDKNNVLRLSIGNGYRVANVFTEDHSALTGSRKVVFEEDLKPETSWNGNINFVKKIPAGSSFIGLDATAFYTYFMNKIIADYDTNPNEIGFGNLNGHAISQGVSLNIDVVFANGLKILAGGTFLDVYSEEEGEKVNQLFTEKFSGTWNAGYTFKNLGLSVDYTGNVYGPMRLPLLSEWDPRNEYSPWWSIQNIQLTKSIGDKIEVYGGIKNLLNWTPNKGNPFIIARSHDPFDREDGSFDDVTGEPIVSPTNPYGLTFDPSYVYGPNQGIHAFLGLRYTY